MRLVTRSDGSVAMLEADQVVPLVPGEGATGWSMLEVIELAGREGLDAVAALAGRSRAKLEDEQLLAPIPLPGSVIAAPVNYVDHMHEMSEQRDIRSLGLFLKARSSVTGPGSTVLLPYTDRRFDQEGELGVVIGRVAENVTAEQALKHDYG